MSYDNVVFWSSAELINSGTSADIIAMGDSWFWYPMYGGSLINGIGDLVKPKSHKILVAGNNGAEAYDFVKGKYKNACNELLRLYGPSASALLISGGGNDFAGFNDMRTLLNDDCSDLATPEACFKPGDADDVGTVSWLLNRTYENYNLLVNRALERLPTDAKIFFHTYDYAVASGKGVFGGESWLQPAMNGALVPIELQQGCIKLLIDRQAALLYRLQKTLPDRIVVVDSRGILKKDDWANELHPTGQGFKKLVKQAWTKPLQDAGLA